MTIVEKAAYLKGLTAGLGVEPDSRDGKLWGALTDLLSDMAHEIEDLQSGSLDFADTLDEVCEDLSYLEEVVDAYDAPEHNWDDEDDFFDDEEDPDKVYDLNLGSGDEDEAEDESGDEENEAETGDEDAEIENVLYDATCPSCGETLTFSEEILRLGSILCPHCGEELEFDLGDEDGDGEDE